MKNQGKGTISVFCAIILIVLTCCTGLAGAEQTPTFKYPYGVFLSICENIEQFADYEIVVIDAQYYPKEELDAFRSKGHKVFSYINIGSLEDFRDYYDEYKDLSLGAYEHWEEEVWVDVSQKRWQDFMLNDIAAGLLEKDIDGFFVDNCDVYYVHPKQEILEGLTVIGTAEPEDHEYFVSYIDRYGSQGAEIYLLEYTIDEELVKEIKAFCEERGYTYYVADSIELDG